MRWLTTPTMISFLQDVSYDFWVSKDGYTKEATLVESSGTRTKLRIAGPGDFGYVKSPQTLKLRTPENVVTPLGSFTVGEVVVYNMLERNKAGGSTELTCVNFVSPSVPF